MKKLTIEQKAKAYDEAIKKLCSLHDNYDTVSTLIDVKEELENIFPELAESKDKKVCEKLIAFLKQCKAVYGDGFKQFGLDIDDALAWLEKQSQVKEFPISQHENKTCKENDDSLTSEEEKIRKAMIKYFTNGKEYLSLTPYSKEDYIAWLEKQDEQKPAMIQWKGDNLKEVIDFTGVYKDGFEKWFHNSWEEYEKYVREHNNIFKIFNEDGSHMEIPVGAWIIKAPDGYNTASRFAISPILTEISIESNFKFKKAIECIENYVNSFPHSQRPEICQHINFLKSFKARVQPQPKQEWSEEDERIMNNCIEYIKASCLDANDLYECIDWLKNKLKSLRPQSTWKPSEYQLEALDSATENCAYSEYQDCLRELIRQLKKQREE